jgi:hypothetical protein
MTTGLSTIDETTNPQAPAGGNAGRTPRRLIRGVVLVAALAAAAVAGAAIDGSDGDPAPTTAATSTEDTVNGSDVHLYNMAEEAERKAAADGASCPAGA